MTSIKINQNINACSSHDELTPINNQSCISGDLLFGNKRSINIIHNDTVYILKITKFNKLVLNK